MQDKANMHLKQLLSNNVDHLKTTTYSRFFNDAIEQDINLVKPNEYYASPRVKKKLDPLATAFNSIGKSRSRMGSTFHTLQDENPMMKTKIQFMAEQKLEGKLR